MVRDRLIVRWLRQNPRLPKVTVGQCTFGYGGNSSPERGFWGRAALSGTLYFAGKWAKYGGNAFEIVQGFRRPRRAEMGAEKAGNSR